MQGDLSEGNFGATYALAGKVIAAKRHAPALYRFELVGTLNDVRCRRSVGAMLEI